MGTLILHKTKRFQKTKQSEAASDDTKTAFHSIYINASHRPPYQTQERSFVMSYYASGALLALNFKHITCAELVILVMRS